MPGHLLGQLERLAPNTCPWTAPLAAAPSCLCASPCALGTRVEDTHHFGVCGHLRDRIPSMSLGLDLGKGVQGPWEAVPSPAYHGSQVMVLSHSCSGLC